MGGFAHSYPILQLMSATRTNLVTCRSDVIGRLSGSAAARSKQRTAPKPWARSRGSLQAEIVFQVPKSTTRRLVRRAGQLSARPARQAGRPGGGGLPAVRRKGPRPARSSYQGPCGREEIGDGGAAGDRGWGGRVRRRAARVAVRAGRGEAARLRGGRRPRGA